MRTLLRPSCTGTKPEKLPSGASWTSVETSRVVRFVNTTSSMLANVTPCRNEMMSPGFCTGMKVPSVMRASSVAAIGLVSAFGPSA